MDEQAELLSPVVGILNCGQMGSAIGAVLRSFGRLDVICALDGRSQVTRERCALAGIRDVGSVAAMVRSADIILSILQPSAALDVAIAVADSMSASKRNVLFVDCNAITPQLATHIGAVIQDAGGRCVDAAIQSAPPSGPGALLYASGPHARDLLILTAHGLDVRVLDGPIGQASAVDQVLGGMVKVFEAAGLQMLLAARQWRLEALLQERVPELIRAVELYAPLMPSRVQRWAGEMRETSEFMHSLGLPGALFTGAAELYELIANSSRVRTSEARREPEGLKEVVDTVASDLESAGVLAKPAGRRP
ncbi:MAG: DUF1932 domain-containing protein [Steroidobacteraceae bacterium]